MKTKSLLAVLGCMLSFTAAADGVPGLRGSDHLGVAVPDLDLERLIAFALEQPAESSNATVERIAGIPPSLGSDRTTLLA